MTQKTEISLARALTELGTLDDRIDKLIASHPGCGNRIGTKVPTGFKDLAEMELHIKAHHDKLRGVMLRQRAVKVAILKANASTTVTVGNESMTIADAIAKKHFIVQDIALVERLKSRVREITRSIDLNNDKMIERLDGLVVAMCGKDVSKVKEEEYENIAKPFKVDNESTMVDPLGISKVIERLQDEIDDFKLNVDAALTEVNVKTLITVGM